MFYGGKEMRGFFYGWYLKCQSNMQTLAVIPALHLAGRNRSCSIQIITETEAWTVNFPADAFHWAGGTISIGNNRFGKRGIQLAIQTPELSVKGKLDFGSLTPLEYSIMGPFSFVPFLECRHSVWSMQHLVCGTVFVNRQRYSFQDAWGYWEGDCGRSFPKKYIWTQCCFSGGSLMLSVADIPMACFHFNGVIAAVLWHGREYRLATYLGAKVAKLQDGVVQIVQGKLSLEARLPERPRKPLKAPVKGKMARTIHESAACRASYRFREGTRVLFAFETDMASFEYEY